MRKVSRRGGNVFERRYVYIGSRYGFCIYERGTIIKAFIVLRDNVVGNEALVQELQDFVKNRIAPYKYPRAIEFIDSLPRTDTGKLQRYVLRAKG